MQTSKNIAEAKAAAARILRPLVFVPQPGDLIVSLTAKPESGHGVMMALWGGLALVTGPCDKPCRFTGLHRRGLQAQLLEDLGPFHWEDFGVWRLTETEQFTASEERALEEIVRHILTHWPMTRCVPPAVAIASLLMRLGKLQRDQPAQYGASMLVSELVRTKVYEHFPVRPAADAGETILPFPAASDVA
jgi:hypothetical protein